jgi:hypothetical protein
MHSFRAVDGDVLRPLTCSDAECGCYPAFTEVKVEVVGFARYLLFS